VGRRVRTVRELRKDWEGGRWFRQGRAEKRRRKVKETKCMEGITQATSP
jgi:hypothetical protein